MKKRQVKSRSDIDMMSQSDGSSLQVGGGVSPVPPRHARGEGGVGGDSHARRQDDDQQGGRHDHRVGGVTKNKNVRSLISVCEDMDTGGGGGLDAVFLLVPEGAGSGRRMSQEFESLRGKFEKLGEGETSGPGCELTNCLKQENVHIQTSFSTLCMGRNKQRARAAIGQNTGQ